MFCELFERRPLLQNAKQLRFCLGQHMYLGWLYLSFTLSLSFLVTQVPHASLNYFQHNNSLVALATKKKKKKPKLLKWDPKFELRFLMHEQATIGTKARPCLQPKKKKNPEFLKRNLSLSSSSSCTTELLSAPRKAQQCL
jgi:hypothetical protein